MPSSDLAVLAARLFADWVNTHHDRAFSPSPETSGEGPDTVAVDGDDSIAIVVRELVEDEPTSPWGARRAAAEARLRDAAPPGAFVLWTPPGADLPGAEPIISDFALATADAAAGLAPGERGAVEFPVTLRLKKLEDEGNFINVLGGMSHLWAGFIGRVNGTYRLDSLAVHRLPEDELYVEGLLATIVDRAAETPFVGETAEIAAVDAWTLQRLPEDAAHGFAIVAVPPTQEFGAGSNVRRSLRRILKETQVRLSGATLGRTYRALVVVGAYTTESREGISVALRGFDPTIYAAVDFIVALVDGRVRPIYRSPRVRL